MSPIVPPDPNSGPPVDSRRSAGTGRQPTPDGSDPVRSSATPAAGAAGPPGADPAGDESRMWRDIWQDALEAAFRVHQRPDPGKD